MTSVPGVSAAGTHVDGSGPYVDTLLFKVIGGNDQQVLALKNNEIDIIGDIVDTAYIDELAASPDVSLGTTLRNGYGYLTINCAKYPFNITAFRRALAFALDKVGISQDVWDNHSVPLDSVVPQINPFSAEGQLPFSYYDADVQKGKDLLAAAGFVDSDTDGYLEGPGPGGPGTVELDEIAVEVAQSSTIAIDVGNKTAEALQALGFRASSVPTDFYDYLNRLYFHGDYDIVFMGMTFGDLDVDWLAYHYWSQYADEPYYNYPNFRNASYDAWREQLLNSTDYDEVYEAAIQMQKILAYESPIVVCYENTLYSAYRTDAFEGHVIDIVRGVPSWWTNQKVRLISQAGGPYGGTFRWSTPLDIETFNIMAISSAYTRNVLNELYDPLLRRTPDGNLMDWLSDGYLIETHADNPDVPVGHTRFTFDIVRNASWSDGVPLTAQDIAFSYNFYRAGSGNPFGVDFQDAFALYAPQDYTFVAEFTSESYWHLSKFADVPIIPKHYFEGMDPLEWNSWNPDPIAEPLITSGPFYVSEHNSSTTVLSRNPYYFRSPADNDNIQSSLDFLSSPSQTPPPGQSSASQIDAQTQALWSDWSKPGFEPEVDPLLEEWLADGTLDKSISLVQGRPSALVYCAPWVDMGSLEDLTDVIWKMDFKAFRLAKVAFPSSGSLEATKNLQGVTLIRADTFLKPVVDEFARPELDNAQTPEFSLDMSELRGIVGATGTVASDYTGDGIVVGHIDTGCDFGVPDLVDAFDNGTYDPTGYGMNPFVLANSSNVADPDAWIADGNVLTYENATGIYLNVTGWDPLLNNEGSGRYLFGDGDENSSYHNRVGFVWLYAYYWGIDVGTMPDDIWQDIRLPDTSEVIGDYRVGFVFEQRHSPYMKAFAPALIYNSSSTSAWNLAIDWDGAEAWARFWDGGFYYKSVNLTDPADTQPILDQCDWDFTDDIAVATYNLSNPIVAADLNGDGVTDYSLGAISWCFDPNSWFSDEPMFNGFRSDGKAVCLYFDDDTHGTATAAHVAGRGTHPYYDANNETYFYMSGIANQSKIMSVRALTSGSEIGAYVWTCGFDYNETSGEFYYTGNHQADLVTNSWGWVTGPSSELTYLSLAWTILSTPGYLDPSYLGVLHVFSAGNEGSGSMTVGPPGCSAGVLSVGASTSSHWLEYLYGPHQDIEGIASFSSKGPSFLGYVKPDVVAPGLAAYAPLPVYAPYLSQYWGTSYSNITLFSGTSQAAPVAAGVAALVIQALNDRNVSWTPDRVKTIIQSTAQRLGYDPATEGFGRVDANAACDFVKNDDGFIVESSDSFDNLMDIAEGSWASGQGSAASILDTDVKAANLPRGFGEGSLYFGQVYLGTATTITQKIYSNATGSFVTDTTGWTTSAYYWREAATYSFTDTTFTYNDTISERQMYGWYNLREMLGSTTYDSSVSSYSYVTIGVSFNSSDVATYGEPWAFLYDWSDDSPNDGVPNGWNATLGQGDELVRLTSASDPSSSYMMSFATNMSSLSSILNGNMTVVIHDPVFDDSFTASGHSFRCTVTFWEKAPATMITAVPGGSSSTYNWTLIAPLDDAGIYQGYVEVSDGVSTITVPWSYTLLGNLSADIGDENTIVSGFGYELSPYDSPVYGCMLSLIHI